VQIVVTVVNMVAMVNMEILAVVNMEILAMVNVVDIAILAVVNMVEAGATTIRITIGGMDSTTLTVTGYGTHIINNGYGPANQ
jgi:hypothetical protein